ncbi:MAG: hypothetical protein ACKO4Q_04825, partial [Planctomycetota bacterium]
MSRAQRLVVLAVALVAALHALSFVGYGPCDDDYIAYDYARSLVENGELAFNPGERIEGFSAPGWMLLAAGAILVGVEPAQASIVLSTLAFAVAAAAVAVLWVRRHPADRWCAPAWLVAASPAVAWHAILGLGTVPLAALLACAFERWDRAARNERTPIAAAALFGLAAFVRNEAVIVAVPFLLAAVCARRGSLVALALGPLAAWQAFRLAYFGRLVPITYSVKKLDFLVDLKLGLEYLAESSAATGLVLALALGLVALARPALAADPVLRGATLAASLFALYVVYVGGDFLPLARFFVPVLPLALLAGCEGFVALFTPRRALAAVALLGALAFESLQHAQRPFLLATHLGSEPRWLALGQTIAKAVPPDTRVALAPIGCFRWSSRLYVVDMLGLTNAHIATVAPDPNITIKGHTRYDAEWVLAQQPDMIILGTGWLGIDERTGERELRLSRCRRCG